MAAVCVPRKGRFTPHGGVKSWYYPAAKTALGSDRCGISWLETNSGGTCWVPPYSCLPSCVHRSAPSLPCTASFLLRSQIAPSHRVSGNESCNPGRAPASSTLVARLPTQASASIAMRTERSPELICLRVTLGSAYSSASLPAAKWGLIPGIRPYARYHEHTGHIGALRPVSREGWVRPDVVWREVQSTVLKWPDLACVTLGTFRTCTFLA